jgi:amino acid transporter
MLNPGPLAPLMQNALIAFAAALFLAVIGLAYFKRKNRKNAYFSVMGKLSNLALANFIISLFLLFFTFEAIPFFSSRFWFLLWGAGILAWAYFIFRHSAAIPQKRLQIEKDREFRKYVP